MADSSGDLIPVTTILVDPEEFRIVDQGNGIVEIHEVE